MATVTYGSPSVTFNYPNTPFKLPVSLSTATG